MVNLTEKAASEVKRCIDEQKYAGETFLRVGIAAGGCSGFSYSLKFDNEYDAQKDSTFEQHGVKLVIDKKSALYLDGAVLDYYEGLDRRGFHFENPNATKTCGCGHSFQA